MKKVKIAYSKLQLNKEKIVELNNQEKSQINGGFTYSLSTGDVCKASMALTAGDAFTCGVLLSLTKPVTYTNQ